MLLLTRWTFEAESAYRACTSLCFVWWWRCPPYTSCLRGVCTASAGAPLKAVSILGRCASGHWRGLDASSLSTLFSSDFYHSPMSFPLPPKMFRQILLFWRMLFWNTAYGVIYCVIFPFSRDYSSLCEVLHFELSGKAEMNHVCVFFFHELL